MIMINDTQQLYMQKGSTDHLSTQLLRKQRDSLSSALCPPTSIDLMSVLPYEVIEMVLGYLPFSQIW